MTRQRIFSLATRIRLVIVLVALAAMLITFIVASAHARMPGVVLPISTSVLVVTLSAFGATLASTRLVARPMARLSRELMDRRQHIQMLDEPASTSAEVLAVIRSFNSLVHELEAAKNSRRALLSGLTHDLRTPLARLHLRAETEFGDEGWARLKPDLWVVGHIIDQIVGYVEGRSDVAPGPIRCLRDLAEDIVTLYRTEGANVTLVCADADAGQVQVPNLGMWRALMNLIDNAFAYGKVPVEVILESQNGYASVTVFDHGEGIPIHDADRAFQPFIRLAEAGSAREHSGLGLAIVKLTSEQLGGTASLALFDGKKSGVTMRWPIQ